MTRPQPAARNQWTQAAGTQPCEKFGVHPSLPFLQTLYEEGDAMVRAEVEGLERDLEALGEPELARTTTPLV